MGEDNYFFNSQLCYLSKSEVIAMTYPTNKEKTQVFMSFLTVSVCSSRKEKQKIPQVH